MPHYVQYKQHPTTHAFEAFAVVPGPNRRAFMHLRRLIALDGTHTHGKYPMTLLAVTSLDANNNIVLLAFALVLIENKEWWKWFLHLIFEAFEKAGIDDDEDPVLFISDADKGLKTALEEEFPSAYHSMCMKHLSGNVSRRFGAQAASFVFRLAKARTGAAYSAIEEELRVLPNGPGAIAYLGTHDVARWARCRLPHERFGGLALAGILNISGLVERLLVIEVSSLYSRVNTATEC